MFGRTAQTSDVSEDRHVSKQESLELGALENEVERCGGATNFLLRLR